MKNIIALLCLLTFPSIYYTHNSVDIRGYQFGESFSTVYNNELQKKEFTIIPSLTNNTRLAYKGKLLNKQVKLFFQFRKQRLSQIAYIWNDLTNETILLEQIQYLLRNKYSLQKESEIPAKNSTIQFAQYYLNISNTNEQICPILTVNLENIIKTNQVHHIILEFQAFDADSTIQNKILSEDI